MPSFLGEKLRCAFGQPAFFLAGNRMTIVAFEKEVSLAKRLYESTEVLISINGKKRFKRILVKGEKFKLQKLPSKDFIAVFFTAESLPCYET